jgi:Carboxypeptidase regulatory-like domain
MALQSASFRVRWSQTMVLCTLLLLVPTTIAQTNTAQANTPQTNTPQTNTARTNTARVQGTVTDTAHTHIGAAAITLTNLDTGALFKTRTDGAGDFTLTALPAGNYQARVQVAGFHSQTKKFSLTASQVRTIHFKLAAIRRP